MLCLAPPIVTSTKYRFDSFSLSCFAWPHLCHCDIIIGQPLMGWELAFVLEWNLSISFLYLLCYEKQQPSKLFFSHRKKRIPKTHTHTHTHTQTKKKYKKMYKNKLNFLWLVQEKYKWSRAFVVLLG